jgi:hypothetical protein
MLQRRQALFCLWRRARIFLHRSKLTACVNGRSRCLGPSEDELLWIRERWAVVANEALREAGLEALRKEARSWRGWWSGGG